MTSESRYALEALDERHVIHTFQCGDDELDEYLHKYAIEDMTRGLARTFVGIDRSKPATEDVAGFFTLRAHALSIDGTFFELAEDEDVGSIEVPLVELMYLARDIRWQRQGIGDTLMIDALRIVARAAECIGFIGMHLRSTERGVPLYERYDFKPFREHPLFDPARYILPVGDIRAIVSSLNSP